MNHIDTLVDPPDRLESDSAGAADVEIRQPPQKIRLPRLRFPSLAFA